MGIRIPHVQYLLACSLMRRYISPHSAALAAAPCAAAGPPPWAWTSRAIQPARPYHTQGPAKARAATRTLIHLLTMTSGSTEGAWPDAAHSCSTHLLFGELFDRPPPDGFPVVDGHPAGELPPPWPFPAPALLPLPPPLPLLPPLHVPPPPPPLRPPRRARTSGTTLTGAFEIATESKSPRIRLSSESSVHAIADAGAASQTGSKARSLIICRRGRSTPHRAPGCSKQGIGSAGDTSEVVGAPTSSSLGQPAASTDFALAPRRERCPPP